MSENLPVPVEGLPSEEGRRATARLREEQASAAADGPNSAFFESVPFVRFDEEGRITVGGGFMGRAFVQMRRLRGERIAVGDGHVATHWVDLRGDAPAVVEKTPCPVTLLGRTLSVLPQPCQIEIATSDEDAVRYDWTAATADLAFDHPGTYRVRVYSVPCLTGEFAVVVDG